MFHFLVHFFGSFLVSFLVRCYSLWFVIVVVAVTLTMTLAEQVRCVTLTDGATAPTATEVYAGTGSGGASGK